MILPVRQKRRQDLGPVQRRNGDQVEDAQADGQLEVQEKAEGPATSPASGRVKVHAARRRPGPAEPAPDWTRPCQSRQGHAPLGIFEVPGVHRHGLGPAEARREHQQQGRSSRCGAGGSGSAGAAVLAVGSPRAQAARPWQVSWTVRHKKTAATRDQRRQQGGEVQGRRRVAVGSAAWSGLPVDHDLQDRMYYTSFSPRNTRKIPGFLLPPGPA